MRRVLKSTVKVMPYEKDGKVLECVRLRFQYNKEWKPYEKGDIKIYRRLEDGFVFDWDEWEYFDLMTPTEDELIFEGELPECGTFSDFLDYDVERGRVYVYWIRKGDSGLAGPLPVKVRNSNIWWSYDRISEKAKAISESFPTVEYEIAGYSSLGRPLPALYIGNKENMIAAVGAMHSGESGPEILLTAAERLLKSRPEVFEKTGLAILPVVSADMRNAMAEGAPPYIRKNARGVDLNRNFDALWEVHDESYGLSSFMPESPTYHGPTPDSEPETKAVIHVMEKAKPLAVYSYHHLCSVTSDRCLSAHEAEGDTPHIAKMNELVRVYSAPFRRSLGLPEAENPEVVLGCSVGSLPSWLYKRGIPCFDLEMSDTTPMLVDSKHDLTTEDMLEKCISAHTEALLETLVYFGK